MADREDRKKNEEAKAPPAPSAREIADEVLEKVAPELKKLAPAAKSSSWWKWLLGGAAVLAVVDQGKLAKTATSFVGMLKAMFGFWGKSALKKADAAIDWGQKWLRIAFWASVTVMSVATTLYFIGIDVHSPPVVAVAVSLGLVTISLWFAKSGALAVILATAFEAGLDALGFFGRFVASNLEKRGVAVPTKASTPDERLAFRKEVHKVVKDAFIILPTLGIFGILSWLSPSWRTFGILMPLTSLGLVILLTNIHLGKKVKLGLELALKAMWVLFLFLVLSIFLPKSAGVFSAGGVDERIEYWLADPTLGSRGLLIALMAPALVLWLMALMTSPSVILTPDRPVDLKRRRTVMAIAASVAAALLIPFMFWTGDITLKGLKEGEKMTLVSAVAEAQATANGQPVPTPPGAAPSKQEPSQAPATTSAADLPPPSMPTATAPAVTSAGTPSSGGGLGSPGPLGWLIILLVVPTVAWLLAIGWKDPWRARLRFIAGSATAGAVLALILLVSRGSITWSGLTGKKAEASASVEKSYGGGYPSSYDKAPAYRGPAADLPPPSRSGYVPHSADLPPPGMAGTADTDHQPRREIPAKRYASFDEALADLQQD